MDGGPRPIEITVRRTDLIGDGFSALHSAGSAIKGRLMVTFISQHGALEAGIDHGGLVKEFLEEASTSCLPSQTIEQYLSMRAS